MINEPILLVADGFQQAWLKAVRKLIFFRWELRNLIVQIRSPGLFDQNIHKRISDFAEKEGFLGPKHIAYTIFPYGVYGRARNAPKLFHEYNRPKGLYERLHRRKPSWGTYFRRMTHYEGAGNVVNQLANIIDAVRTRENLSKAAYTVVIQNPGRETVRPRGGPCLNYIAVQIDSSHSATVGLLAVFRNHDFLEKAYGNYWGLCNLLRFLAAEMDAQPGPLTCISSHAYVITKMAALKALVEGL